MLRTLTEPVVHRCWVVVNKKKNGAPLAKISDTAKSQSGYFRETSRLEPGAAKVTGAMSVYNLLRRRGIAWDMAGLCGFEAHAGLVKYYFEIMDQDPPSNFDKVSIEQVRLADEEVMRQVKRYTIKHGVRKTLGGNLPVEEACSEGPPCHATAYVFAIQSSHERSCRGTRRRADRQGQDEGGLGSRASAGRPWWSQSLPLEGWAGTVQPEQSESLTSQRGCSLTCVSHSSQTGRPGASVAKGWGQFLFCICSGARMR